MNKYKKYLFTLVLTVVLGFISPLFTIAQGGPGDPGCDPLDPACPIDGGLSILIAAGIGLGAKKMYNLKNKTNKEI